MLMEEAGGPHIRHWCQIPVPDPRNHSQYSVSVRAKEEETLIKSSDNSEFAPSLRRGAPGDSGASLGHPCTRRGSVGPGPHMRTDTRKVAPCSPPGQ